MKDKYEKASEVDNDFFAKMLLGVAQGVGKGSKGIVEGGRGGIQLKVKGGKWNCSFPE